jgi:hypothetical protein
MTLTSTPRLEVGVSELVADGHDRDAAKCALLAALSDEGASHTNNGDVASVIGPQQLTRARAML